MPTGVATIWALSAAVIVGGAPAAATPQPAAIVIGSKAFTESVILGEIAKQIAVGVELRAEHRREIGGTHILFNALADGQIDVYPEYTGTISEEILAKEELGGIDEIRGALAERGIRMTEPLGFNNTYAIGMRPQTADQLGIRTISDLRRHPDLRFGFTNEFMNRGDGWPALRQRYALGQQDVRGLDHALALRALQDGSIDATDLYSTDAEIAFYGFRVLEDDLVHFPRYDALFLYRAELEQRVPEFVEALRSLTGALTEAAMIDMNQRVKIEREPEGEVAVDFVRRTLGMRVADFVEASLLHRQLKLLGEHLYLVGISMALAIIVSIPLGIAAARYARSGQVILAATGIIQTVPALALLVLLMPVPWPREAGRPDILGIGTETAIAALFLYSLLPIVRNTQTALRSIDLPIRESAEALGLSAWSKLIRIELPLGSRTILAGIKTAVVINIGFATLAAFIHAGGYGQPILTGIHLDDFGLILEGAVPAALLALAAQGLFELAERTIVPRGLRLRASA